MVFPKSIVSSAGYFLHDQGVDGGFGIPKFYPPNTTQDQISGPSKNSPRSIW